MANTRITAVWNGASGLPGYTRMRFGGAATGAEAATLAGRMRTYFDSIKALIPAAVTVGFQESAQTYDELGELTGDVGFTPPALVAGTGSGSFAGPVGMVVNWITGAIVSGHKVRGRSFMVPLASAAFATDGTPATTSVTTIQTAAAALIAGTPSMVIVTQEPGLYATSNVISASVPDRAAVLRSRRD